MTARVYFMIGLPFDNDDTITKYFQKALRLSFDEYSLYPLIPYPGTPLWNEPEKFGYEIVDPDFTHYVQIGKGGNTCFALKHKNFLPETIYRWYHGIKEIMKSAGKKLIIESTIAR